jgi:glycosidase
MRVRQVSFWLSLGLLAPGMTAGDFASLAARPAPEWARDGIVYEVFPRVFSPTGNLAGVTARLDEIRRLGVTIVWLMPIHPIGQARRKGTYGSPYSIQDYDAVNPDYGTKEDLKTLVREAHARGLKVILDVVANHTAWDSVLMSAPELYRRDASGRVLPPNPDWSDVAQLDYANPRTRRLMADVLEHWLREADLDGFRCDMAGLLPTSFWEEARPQLDRVKAGLFLLAEWSGPELLLKAFDADYGWPFHTALSRVLSRGAPASDVRATWEEERRTFPKGTLHLRFSDNHDERRAVARFGEAAALAASALVLTLDGIPLVYNGMEAGDAAESGGPALGERLPIFWPIAERRPEFPRFYAQMIALRRAHAALRQGETVWLPNADESRVVSYLRQGGGEEFLIAINLSSQPWAGQIQIERPASLVEVTPDVPPPLLPGANTSERRLAPPSWPTLRLDAWGFRMFRRPIG